MTIIIIIIIIIIVIPDKRRAAKESTGDPKDYTKGAQGEPLV